MNRILRLPEVRSALGQASKATIYNRIAAGLLPQPVSLGPRMVGWPSLEIEAIIAARIAGATDADVRVLVARLHAERHAGSARKAA